MANTLMNIRGPTAERCQRNERQALSKSSVTPRLCSKQVRKVLKPAVYCASKPAVSSSRSERSSPLRASTSEVEATTKSEEFDFKKYMTEKAALVELALDKSTPQQYPEKINESMRYTLLAGGKRLRPVLCLAACEMFGGTVEEAMPTACALEMVHTMSLIHDDLPCMDDDDYRRGVLTNHMVYGEQVAILAGDALLTKAFEYIARETPKSVPAERTLQVVAHLGKCVGSEGLVGGQIVDLEMEGNSEAATLDTLKYIHAHKTGALLDAAVVNGAILGGATQDDVERLTRYSQDIGLAFQVIDDILDCTMTSEQLGKTAGKDEDTGKTTYPALIGLEESRVVAQELIDNAKAELSIYPEDLSAPLMALADYVGFRQN
ncbi:Geranylgeranyl pyrophosphate synthase [Cymbomonas tetramitiformis]|uniref:Geranylgeranyl pyrophosphate synthase n=1 Tax=Cymbomonas tetramitiformis TaxID=36881 RepID=A0AAE0BKH9_9CHLO|nr:Geranylgeranyl pyrophosphate synthase [Cymbomonas tetramitiformis]|eukprot:gene5506-6669_t